MLDNPADKLNTFNHLFLDVLDQHAQLKTVRVRKNLFGLEEQYAKRWTEEIGSISFTDRILLHLGTFMRQNKAVPSSFGGMPRLTTFNSYLDKKSHPLQLLGPSIKRFLQRYTYLQTTGYPKTLIPPPLP